MIIYNEGQKRVIDEGVKFLKSSSEQVFQFSGGPGTGKSVVLNGLVEASGIPRAKILPMAYTGAAAIVMRSKGLLNATTIHSGLFTPIPGYRRNSNGDPLMNDYLNRPISDMEFIPTSTDEYDLFVIDEGSMVPMSLKHEIERRGKKIIVCGDTDQLPPVNDKSAYLIDGEIYYLTEIIRQANGSYIPFLAQRVKQGLPIHTGLYGDVLIIEPNDLNDRMLMNASDIICGRNATRDKINYHIRHDILGYDTDLPLYMEKVICRKNNRGIEVANINLANGLSGKVMTPPDPAAVQNGLFTMSFKPDNFPFTFENLICDYAYFTAPHSEKAAIKSSKYSCGEKFEFSYAKTTHLSQGSQSHHGVYIQEYISQEINDRLNYTGVTRFQTGLIYVVPPRKYF